MGLDCGHTFCRVRCDVAVDIAPNRDAVFSEYICCEYPYNKRYLEMLIFFVSKIVL